MGECLQDGVHVARVAKVEDTGGLVRSGGSTTTTTGGGGGGGRGAQLVA